MRISKAEKLWCRRFAFFLCVLFQLVLTGCPKTELSWLQKSGGSLDAELTKWEDKVLILVDYQNAFFGPALQADNPNFANNTKELLAWARSEGIEIVHVLSKFKKDKSDWPLYYRLEGSIPCLEGAPDQEMLQFVDIMDGERVFYKNRFDSFANGELTRYLKRAKKKHVYIAGLVTSVCVLTTAFSAYQNDLFVTLIKDCVADSKETQSFILNKYKGLIFDTTTVSALIDD